MTPELWARLKPLFDAAIEKHSAERDAFVAEACGEDLDLRRELTALVDAHARQNATTERFEAGIHQVFAEAHRRFAPAEVVLGRFRIVRQLGSGGMGDVYEAFDMELTQTVALKSIRADIADNQEVLSRFKKEVQLARRLSGPNLCRIHELFVIPGDGAGPPGAFLTMELLEGETLAERVQRTGPIAWREAKEILSDICAGLSTMHEAGIVHRDLKTRNIMLALRDGVQRAVLMDFGLARKMSLSGDGAETRPTLPGAILGTPEYMAPEQFEGKEVSPATDIYALGVVLYEMLTGKHPFAAPNAIGAAVLRAKKPESASSIQHGVPHRLDAVIGKCLEYEPKGRYQSAEELARELRTPLGLGALRQRSFRLIAFALSPAPILICLLLVPPIRERLQGILFSSHEKHIVLLPFDIASADKEVVAIGDGFMESLTGRLSNLDRANSSLWVVPASEVRNRKVTSPIGAMREFGATIVVTGRFERSGPAAHLQLTLIDPKRTREIGYAEVSSPTGDLGSLEDDAVTRLGRLMNISIPRSAEAAEPAPRAPYEDYLAGVGYLERIDKPGNAELAIDSLQNAAKNDPSFALAWARLAQVCTQQFLMTSDKQWLDGAEENAKRSIQLDKLLPLAHAALGHVHDLRGRHDLAIDEFQRALALAPHDSDVLSSLANSYKLAGNRTGAEKAYLEVIALRPDDWKGYNDLGIFYQGIGRSNDAISQFKHALQLTPDNAWPYVNLAIAYLDFDDPNMRDKAEIALKTSIEKSPTFAAYANLAFLYAQERRFKESVAASLEALKLNDQNYDVWLNLMDAYEWQKDDKDAAAARDKAIELAEQAVSVNPGYEDAQAKLAALYARKGLRDKAMTQIQFVLALQPEDAYVLSQIADAYELLGQRAKAIQILHTALKQGLSRATLSEDPALQYLVRDPHFRAPVS
jgi:eukaryotic-like serine/threonine-protein kinase